MEQEMNDIRRYVLGFAFDDERVLLIRKRRPAWQEGYLNGVGGRIEEGERAAHAMVREFEEETGLPTTEKHWEVFAVMITRGQAEVHCYRAELGKLLDHARTTTDEEVLVVGIWDTHKERPLPSVPWLVFAAKDKKMDHVIAMYNPDG